jgi:hypothetical protein
MDWLDEELEAAVSLVLMQVPCTPDYARRYDL